MECILTADTGSGESEQYKVATSIEKLIKRYPKISSVIIAGDNIYPDGCDDIHDEQFNTKFRDMYQNIDLPFYLCLGNHDYHKNAQSQIDYTFSDDNMYFWRHFNEINISPLSDLMEKDDVFSDDVFSDDCFQTLYDEIKEKEKIYFK